MESTDQCPSAVAIANVRMALRRAEGSVGLYWGPNAHHQDILTESLRVLGLNVDVGSADFEVPPAQMPEVAELLVLTQSGVQKLDGVI